MTGHTYIVYGPLAIGARSLMFEGVPTFPAGDRFWQVIAKHKVNLFFTAPTAIRALHGLGDELVTRHDRSSLRIIGRSVNPLTPRPGSGITAWSVKDAAPSSIPGGKPKRVV